MYKRITISEKRSDVGAHVELLDKDVENIWDAVVDDEEKVTLSKNYGETIDIWDKNIMKKRLYHVAETIKFSHVYSFTKPDVEPVPVDMNEIPEPATLDELSV